MDLQWERGQEKTETFLLFLSRTFADSVYTAKNDIRRI